MKHLAILGTGGHSTVISEIAILNGYTIMGYYDDKESQATNYLGPIKKSKSSQYNLICAIGDNNIRKKITREIPRERWMTLIHPHAIISSTAKLGHGTVVCAGAVVQAECKIGEHCIINTNATIDHESIVGDYCHIAPGVTICGNVYIGSETFIGAGSTIIEKIYIGDKVLLGAHSLVIRNINSGMAFGVPTKQRL